jgi:hypothetical protein
MNKWNALLQLNKAAHDTRQAIFVLEKLRAMFPARFERYNGESELRHLNNELRALDLHFNRIAKIRRMA